MFLDDLVLARLLARNRCVQESLSSGPSDDSCPVTKVWCRRIPSEDVQGNITTIAVQPIIPEDEKQSRHERQ